MAIRKTSVSPFSIYAFILWSVLYFGVLCLLEQQFPDAAFSRTTMMRLFGVWIVGSIASMFCGWLLKNWLEKGFPNGHLSFWSLEWRLWL